VTFGAAAWIGLLRSLLVYHGVPFKIRRLARLYRLFVRPGDVCFDLGAHVGDRTRALLRLGAKVVAVEPQPLFGAFLTRAYHRNPRVTIVAAAVGRVAGEAVLYLSERNPTVSSAAPAWIDRVKRAPRFAGVRWEREVAVPVTTLDLLIEQHGEPTFCKIDIEGGEAESLQGLSRAIQALSFEYLPALRAESRACVERLEQLGRYEYNWSVREAPRLRSENWLGPEEMLTVLASVPDDAHSGDVYARLKSQSSADGASPSKAGD
jgi:FkbM family methyltransferase